jgi:hypothetical protein
MPKNSDKNKDYAGPNYKTKSSNLVEKIKVEFFNRQEEPLERKDSLIELSKTADRLYLVIKQENIANEEELANLSSKIKIYYGEAWYLIHKRRLEEDK